MTAAGRGCRGRRPAGVVSVITGNDYRQGGAAPFAQTTAEPGGTTIVVPFFGGAGSLLLKLTQPATASGRDKMSR
jgi:hypothetical protein